MTRKIFHVSTSLNGGAGIAALNLHSILLSEGFESVVLTLDSIDRKNIPGLVSIKRTPLETLIGKFFTFLQQRFNNYTFFSTLSGSAKNLKDYLLNTSGDSKVVHIHNWYNFLDLKWLKSLEDYGFEIVLTLHDQRLMTGGCHYSGECRKFETECAKCPLAPKYMSPLVLYRQDAISSTLGELRNIRLITPSKWLKDEALKSRVLHSLKISVIPNLFPHLQFLRYEDLDNVKPRDSVTIGIASMDPFASIKGGEFVRSLASNLDGFELVFLRDYTGDAEEFWKKTQILLVPSIQDNSPNVIHEAKQRGIPVIGSNVGGIPELLSKDYDLIIQKEITVSEFNELLSSYKLRMNKIPNLHHSISSNYANFSMNSKREYLDFMKFNE